MKILAVGDLVGTAGLKKLRRNIKKLKKKKI